MKARKINKRVLKIFLKNDAHDYIFYYPSYSNKNCYAYYFKKVGDWFNYDYNFQERKATGWVEMTLEEIKSLKKLPPNYALPPIK